MTSGTPVGLTNTKYEKLKPVHLPSERRQCFQMSHSTPLSKQISSDRESMASPLNGPDEDHLSSTPSVILSLPNSDTDTHVSHSGNLTGANGSSNKLVGFPVPLPTPAPSTTVAAQSKAKLYLKPPSLHISFEIDADQRQYRNQELSTNLQVSRSLANFVDCYRPVSRSSPFRNRQLEIADISAEYMRLNGVTPQFKRILSTNDKTKDSHYKGQYLRGFEEDIAQSICASPAESGGKDSDIPQGFDQMTVRLNPRPSCHPQVSYRLAKRRQIFECRRRTADCSLILSTCGIALMILENELTAANIYNAESTFSHLVKFFILMSTCLLLGTIIIYHGLEIKMFMIDNSCEDWRLAVDISRVWRICTELLVCAICPIPGNFAIASSRHAPESSDSDSPPVSLDVFLSIAMFCRLYLIFRAMLLHSRLYTDTASRSIGALNRIKFTTGFILKTLTTARPGTVLVVFTLSFWTIAAWIMRLCERNRIAELSYSMDDPRKHQNYLNSLWLIAITSLTVGYGDIVPNTYCGRTISVLCGLVGMATSSLVVAVVARKLELSRAEKHVNNFMFDSKLTKQLKHAAANVLQETWLIYKYKKHEAKGNAAHIRNHQRKFLKSIYELRRVKTEQRRLAENSATISDIDKTVSTIFEIVTELRTWQSSVDSTLTSLQNKSCSLENTLQQIQANIKALPELIVQQAEVQNCP